MYRLLIIEDDKGISEAIRVQAEMWNLEVNAINDFRNVLQEFASFMPHIVLLDITLPFFDGYHWCAEIRKISQVPIIFISSASENMNMIMAMNMGADDFVAKPFDQCLLMAKIQALLRRTYDFGQSAPIIVHQGITLNTGDHTLTYKEKHLELSKNEYGILCLLLRNKGKIVSREKIMDELWQTDCFIDENTLSVNINRLRKRLEDIGIIDLIHTKFGIGYIIEE